jgi:hypothetical protein
MMEKVQDSVTTDANPAYFGPVTAKRHPPLPPGKSNQAGAGESTAATPDPQ